MELYEVIRQRRSVRKYMSDPVPQEILDRLLDAAQWAPSWANTQCPEVVLCDDPEVRARIHGCVPERNPAHAAVGEAPLIAVFCARKDRAGFKGGQPATHRGDWKMFDVALCMENFMLAAQAEGLGTVCVGIFDDVKTGELLGLPPEMEVIAITPLGFPAHEAKAPPRRNRAEFLHKNRYGQAG